MASSPVWMYTFWAWGLVLIFLVRVFAPQRVSNLNYLSHRQNICVGSGYPFLEFFRRKVLAFAKYCTRFLTFVSIKVDFVNSQVLSWLIISFFKEKSLSVNKVLDNCLNSQRKLITVCYFRFFIFSFPAIIVFGIMFQMNC